jgi:hypothetical protein
VTCIVQFQNGGCVMSGQVIISGNFAKFSPNCTVYVFHVVLYSGLTLYDLMYFCWCNNNERTNQVELRLLGHQDR